MKLTVFIHTIHQEAGRPTTVTALNGRTEGPPLLMFEVPSTHTIPCRIGQRVSVTLEFDQ
jgi:hypothetical protein